MFGLSRRLLLTVVLLVTAPLVALCELKPEELANRAKVEQGRADPAVYDRYRAAAAAFLQLPPERQEQLLRLDRELDGLPPPQQNRLLNVGRRYVQWLDRLPEAERQKILAAPDQKTRVRRIRELREAEWIGHLPARQREIIEKATDGERARKIEEYRRKQRQRHQLWQVVLQHWNELVRKLPLPSRLTDFPADVQTYVTEYLRPSLAPEQRTRLDRAQGAWPNYPFLLVRMADQHPMALPGPAGPTQFKELPADVRQRLAPHLRKPDYAIMNKMEGKWPDFAIVVTNRARHYGVRLPYELWPSRPEDLSAGVKTYLDKRLLPRLSDPEKARIKNAEGKWPLYPRTLQELAVQHKLPVPWQTLPGPRDKWDSYRIRPARPTAAAANPALLKAAGNR